MNSGIISSVSPANQVVFVKLRGRDEADEKPYRYPKVYTPVVGDEVAIDNIDGSYRIIAIY